MNNMKKVRCGICLLLGVITACAFGKHISLPFGLLLMCMNILSVLLPEYIIRSIQRQHNDLLQPVRERICSIPGPILYRWICQRKDAEILVPAEDIQIERKRYFSNQRWAPLSDCTWTLFYLTMRVNVWSHTAAWLIRIQRFPSGGVLVGLAAIICIEMWCWRRNVYRLALENQKLREEAKRSVMTMPADELNELVERSIQVWDDTHAEKRM